MHPKNRSQYGIAVNNSGSCTYGQKYIESAILTANVFCQVRSRKRNRCIFTSSTIKMPLDQFLAVSSKLNITLDSVKSVQQIVCPKKNMITKTNYFEPSTKIKSVKILTMESAENPSGVRLSVAECNRFAKAYENGTCILCPIGSIFMSCSFQNTEIKKPTSPGVLTCSFYYRN